MSDTNDKDKNDAHERAKAQFARTAQGYVTSASHAHGEELALLLELAAPVAGRRVLDVATGGGHVALAFARAGALVTALDLTPAMLEAARAFLASRGVAAHFVEGAAEALPFEDASFEVVACRIAAHHFRDPARFVREAARVLVPGGSFLLADNVAPLNAELAAAMNAVERRRDPSHVRARPGRGGASVPARRDALGPPRLARARGHAARRTPSRPRPASPNLVSPNPVNPNLVRPSPQARSPNPSAFQNIGSSSPVTLAKLHAVNRIASPSSRQSVRRLNP